MESFTNRLFKSRNMTSNIQFLLTIFFIFMIIFVFFPPPENLFGRPKQSLQSETIKQEHIFKEMPETENTKFLIAARTWKNCFSDALKKVMDDPKGMWYWIREATNKCKKESEFSRIELTSIKNKDEMKYHLYSKEKNPSVVVTLGIGLDVLAETQLKNTLPNGTRFYGADPIFKGNADLFEPLGPYFPFAVGNEIAVSTANVLHEKKYKKMTMPHIDIITFFNKFLQESKIDQLLMDNEGPEYDILPMMGKGKEFDQNEIVVCQCNTEVHTADDEKKEKFLSIMKQIIADERYAFLVSYATVHHRFYFINIEHPYCVDKYLARFFD